MLVSECTFAGRQVARIESLRKPTVLCGLRSGAEHLSAYVILWRKQCNDAQQTARNPRLYAAWPERSPSSCRALQERGADHLLTCTFQSFIIEMIPILPQPIFQAGYPERRSRQSSPNLCFSPRSWRLQHGDLTCLAPWNISVIAHKKVREAYRGASVHQ